MTLHMPKQARHLAEDVTGQRKIEELNLCSVKVALCPLDKWPIPEDPPDQDQASVRTQRLLSRRLSGCFKVAMNGIC